MKKFLVFILSVTLGASLGAAAGDAPSRRAIRAAMTPQQRDDEDLSKLAPAKLTEIEAAVDGALRGDSTPATIDAFLQKYGDYYGNTFGTHFSYYCSLVEMGGSLHDSREHRIQRDYKEIRERLGKFRVALIRESGRRASEVEAIAEESRRRAVQAEAEALALAAKQAQESVEAERKRLAEEVAAAEEAQRLAIQAEAEVVALAAQRAQEAAEAEKKQLAEEAAAAEYARVETAKRAQEEAARARAAEEEAKRAEEARKAQEILRALEVEKARKAAEVQAERAAEEAAAKNEKTADSYYEDRLQRKIFAGWQKSASREKRLRNALISREIKTRRTAARRILQRWHTFASEQEHLGTVEKSIADAYNRNLMRKALGGWKTYLAVQQPAQRQEHEAALFRDHHQLSSAFTDWRVFADKHRRREAAIALLRGQHDKSLLRNYFNALASHAHKQALRSRACYRLNRIVTEGLATAFKHWKENTNQPLQDALGAQAPEPVHAVQAGDGRGLDVCSALDAAFKWYQISGDCQDYADTLNHIAKLGGYGGGLLLNVDTCSPFETERFADYMRRNASPLGASQIEEALRAAEEVYKAGHDCEEYADTLNCIARKGGYIGQFLDTENCSLAVARGFADNLRHYFSLAAPATGMAPIPAPTPKQLKVLFIHAPAGELCLKNDAAGEYAVYFARRLEEALRTSDPVADLKKQRWFKGKQIMFLDSSDCLAEKLAHAQLQQARLAGLDALARDLQLKDAFSRWKLAAAEKPADGEAVHPDVQAVLDDILLNVPADTPDAEARDVLAARQQQLVAPVQEVPLLVALPVVHERPALPAHLSPITEEVPGGSVTASGQSALSQSQSPALSDAPSSQSASPTPDQGGSGPLVLDDLTEKKSGVMPDGRSSKNDYSTWLLGSGAGLTLAGAALLMGQQTPKGRLNALTDALRSNSQLTPRQKARILGGLLTLAAGVTVGAVGAYQKLD